MFNLTKPQNVGLLNAAILYEQVPTSWTASPSDMFPGWTINGSTIEVPVATFSDFGLTAANADGTTGDARQVLFALSGRAFQWWNDLTTEPEAMSSKFTRGFQTSGDLTGSTKNEYRFTFWLDYPGMSVSDEPS